MSQIGDIKRELYNLLKNEAEVTGAGIKGSGQTEHIVIFVKELTARIKGLIPSNFKGKKVKVEVKKTAVPM